MSKRNDRRRSVNRIRIEEGAELRKRLQPNNRLVRCDQVFRAWSGRRYEILTIIALKHRIKVSDIAAQLHVKLSQVSRDLGDLKRVGLVELDQRSSEHWFHLSKSFIGYVSQGRVQFWLGLSNGDWLGMHREEFSTSRRHIEPPQAFFDPKDRSRTSPKSLSHRHSQKDGSARSRSLHGDSNHDDTLPPKRQDLIGEEAELQECAQPNTRLLSCDQVFRVWSGHRYKILTILALKHRVKVSDIAALLHLRLPQVSRDLGTLKRVGLVEMDRKKTEHWFHLSPSFVGHVNHGRVQFWLGLPNGDWLGMHREEFSTSRRQIAPPHAFLDPSARSRKPKRPSSNGHGAPDKSGASPIPRSQKRGTVERLTDI